MNVVSRTFLAGLAGILPITITLAVLWWLGTTAENALEGLLAWLVPAMPYFPGMGLAAGIGLVFAAGVLLRAWLVQGVFRWVEGWMQRIPVVKTIYGVVSDMMGLVSGDLEQKFGEAVLVTLPGTDYRLVGFVTRKDFAGLPARLGGAGTVAVYLPMSYQIGGYTLVLPAEQVVPLGLPLEDAMRFALTAGVSAQRRSE
jgi:uncharacterized membrane protein